MYKLYKNPNGEINAVLRLADNSIVPFTTANIDYLDYLDWLAQGNTPEPADGD